MTHICLACGGKLGEILFSIPDLPLVDSFSASQEEASLVPTFSVELRQCVTCLTIQIEDPPDTSEIYKNYIYESSSSPDLDNHFTEYAQYIASLAGDSNQSILEIGANDGLLLSKLSQAGFTNLTGVDPSPQTANICINGVNIINNFFTPESVKELDKNSFSIIIANNCFSHIPHLSETLSLCAKLLKKTGTLVVEVQSCLDLIEGVIFDYIYHEHYFYHSVHSFEKLANISGLQLYRVEHVSTKGGSYRLLLGHQGIRTVDGSVSYWKYREDIAAIHTDAPWSSMRIYLKDLKAKLFDLINHNNEILVGYGASATGTVFLRYMEIEKFVKFIVDDNTKRQNLFSPKASIPIVASSLLSSTDTCLILAWRHAKYIIPKLKMARIKSINPLPFLQYSE